MSWSARSDERAVDSQTDILTNTADFCSTYKIPVSLISPADSPGCDEPFISLVDVASGSVTPIGAEFMGSPPSSPNGREIAFNDQSLPSRNQRLGIMSASGAEIHDLLTLSGHGFGNGEIGPTPGWSADGKQVVFASYDRHRATGSEGLYAVDVHNRRLTALTRFGIYATQWVSSPSWVQPLTLCTVPKLNGQTL